MTSKRNKNRPQAAVAGGPVRIEETSAAPVPVPVTNEGGTGDRGPETDGGAQAPTVVFADVPPAERARRIADMAAQSVIGLGGAVAVVFVALPEGEGGNVVWAEEHRGNGLAVRGLLELGHALAVRRLSGST